MAINWDEVRRKAQERGAAAEAQIQPVKVTPSLPRVLAPNKTETVEVKPTLKPRSTFQSVLPEYNMSLPGISQAYAKSLPQAQKQEIAQGTKRFFEQAPTQAGFMQGFSLNNPVKTLEKNLDTQIDTSQAEASLPYKVGEGLGIASQFAIPYAGASKGIGTLTAKALPNLPKLGQKIAGSVATDLAVGLPLNVNYAYNKEGLQGTEAAKSIGVNTAIDLITGGILEAIGGIILKSGKKVATREEFVKLTPQEQQEALLMLPAPKETESKLIGANKIIAGNQIVDKKFVPKSKDEVMAELAQKIGESPNAEYAPGLYSKTIQEDLNKMNGQLNRLEDMPDAKYEAFAQKNNLGDYVADFSEKPVTTEPPLIFKTQVNPNKLPMAAQPIPQATGNPVQPVLPKKGTRAPKERPFAKIGDFPKAQKPLPGANKEMNILDRAYQQTVDNQFAIGKATKGIKQTADKDAKILASNARNSKGTAEYAIKVGLTDMEGKRVTDYSLEQLLLRPRAEQEAYQDYLLHKHNIDRYKQDKPVFGNDVTDTMSKQKVAEYESQYPQFKGLRENLTDFNEKVVDEWLVKGGLIDAKLGDLLKKMYKNYVPTIREGSVPGKQFKTKGLAPGQVVKEAVGGNKPIMSISKSYPIMVEKAIKSARKNEVYLGLLDAVEKNPDKMARWAKVMDETAEKKYKDAITVTDATEAIQKNGLDGIEAVSNKQLEIDSQNGKYYVTAMRDGKPVRMEIHKDLFDALDSLNRIGNEGQLDGMAAAVKKYATNPFKALITGYNPVFGLKNIFRDIPTAYIQGTENNPLKFAANLARAGKSIAKKDETYQEFLALGGKKGNFFDAEKGLQIESVPTKVLRSGLEKIGAFNNTTEMLPRLGEYIGTVKREGGDYAAKQKGIYNAGEVTVNFNRQGDKTKAVDTVVPYLNPAVQGIDKAIRNLRHPLTYAKGAAAVTAPTTALYILNQAVDKEAYDQLDNRTKDTNYLIPTGSGQFIKIPKSRESGVLFGSLFERLFRLAEGQQDSFKGFGNTVATNFAPSNPIENNLLAPATLNLATNKDFADRTIVPLGMLNDNRSPYLQYDEQTSEIAKWIGEQSRNLPGLKEGLSPKQIDYLIKSYTGIVGQILQPATTKGGSPFENVIKRGFTADNVYNNEIQNNFYEKFDEAKRVKSDLNLNNDIPSDYITPEEKRVSVYNKASLEMSELRKQEKKLTAEGANDEKLKQIRKQILNIAEKTPAEAERVYEQYKKTYVPELSMMSEKQVRAYNELLKPFGVSPKQYRDAYLAQKDYGSNVQKAIALSKTGHSNMYLAFDISENSAMLGEAIQNSGLDQTYNQLYIRLKDGDSQTKKSAIDFSTPNLTREQRELLYEAFNVSQAVGKYKRKFND